MTPKQRALVAMFDCARPIDQLHKDIGVSVEECVTICKELAAEGLAYQAKWGPWATNKHGAAQAFALKTGAATEITARPKPTKGDPTPVVAVDPPYSSKPAKKKKKKKTGLGRLGFGRGSQD